MGGVGEGADRILDGVGCGGAGDPEGKAGERRAEHDLFACCPIGAILAGGFEPLPEKFDGAQRKLVGQRVLSDEDTLLRNARYGLAADGGKGLQGMGQRICAGNRRQPWRAGKREFGIADGNRRDEIRARYADFQAALRVRQNGDGRHLRSRSGGGGNRDQRQDGSWNGMFAVILLGPPSMGEKKRDALRHVQAGAAADADDEVRLEIAGVVGARNRRFDGDVRQGRAVHQDGKVCGFQLADQRAQIGVRGKARVGDDQRALPELWGDCPERMALAGSEEQFARRPQCAE